MILLTAFQATLVHWTGQEEVVVGCNLANRERPGTGDLVGLFLNMLVWRTDLAGDPSFLAALDRVRRVTLDAYAHADIPFDRLVELLRPERVPGLHPLFQVKVDFQNLPIEMPAPTGLAFAPCELDFGRVHNDLTLYIRESGPDLSLAFEYAVDLFDEATVAALGERFEVVLATVVDEPEVRLKELVRRLDASDERRRLAAEASFKESQQRRLKLATRRAVGSLSGERQPR
jgi:non-ribosomal peptide synthetase component F